VNGIELYSDNFASQVFFYHSSSTGRIYPAATIFRFIRFSILNSQFSILNSQFSILNFIILATKHAKGAKVKQLLIDCRRKTDATVWVYL